MYTIFKQEKVDMHMPSSKLTLFQKGVQYSGSKIFNHLPSSIKDLSNDVKSFKVTLKNFLLTHIFYTVDEFFKRQSYRDFGLCINLYYKYTLF
jgi:hypothetical protein